jgi:hypothetical protein
VFTLGAYMAYYEAAMQVIPTLMFMLFVGENRYFKAKRSDSRCLWLVLSAICILFLGEVMALRTLERGHDSAFLWACTTAGLVYALLLVFQSAVRTLLLNVAHINNKRREGLERLNIAVALVALVFTAIVFFPGD